MSLENKKKIKERTRFKKRLKQEGVDMYSYAQEEKVLREKHPHEKKIYETSETVESAIMRTLHAKEELGRDALTGAMNLRRYREEIERLQKEATYQKTRPRRKTDIPELEEPFSILTLDIDHFKKINDTYGHHAGDEVLKEVVHRIQKRLRSGDMVARVGGEEFRIIALKVNGSSPGLAEDLRHLISKHLITVTDNQRKKHVIRVTVSIGVAPFDADTNVMEKNSDAALYMAKKERNLVCVWDEKEKAPVSEQRKKAA